jgi:hypothetical protein
MAWNMDDYEPVSSRIDRFYAKYPAGRILTEIVARGDNDWVVKALAYRREKDTEPSATGFAQEIVGSNPVNRTSALENCETSAIGRALANLGFDAKGQRASREEMEKVERQNSAGSASSPSPSQQKRAAEPKASASPPNHSRGGDTPQAAHPSSSQAAPKDVSPPRDQSQVQEVASHNKENEPEGAPVGNSVPPGSESWVAIKQAVESGALKQTSVHIHAATLCTGRDGVAVPSRFEDVKDCPDDILAAVADHFKVGVAA